MNDWTRHGDCNHCGWCCTKVARDVIVRTDDQVARDPAFYAARGFVRQEVDGEPRHVLWAWLEAPCPQHQVRHFHDGLGGMIAQSHCGVYDARPRTCQEFPTLPVDVVGTPCSYWFERGDAKVGGTGSPYPKDERELMVLEEGTA
jgi:Fe-S-cluster containining protein